MDTYGLIGFPLKHSFSSKFFNEKFLLEKIDAEYLNFEIADISEIRRVILFNQHLKGLNVTIPYKEQVIPYLNEISSEAKQIGAINTIKIERIPGDMYSHRLIGYNTDYIGFKNSLTPLLDPLTHKKALVLGTGGASKAVSKALTDIGIEWIYISRNKGKDSLIYEELTNSILDKYQIIVNTTPLGTYPNTESAPDIPYEAITSNHILYDLTYNPSETLFLKKGKANGATIKNGEEMLLLQAKAAWDIWRSH